MNKANMFFFFSFWFCVIGHAAVGTQTGEDPQFWKGKAIVVAQTCTSEWVNRAFVAQFKILGVSYADVYVPSSLVVSNAGGLVNPAVFFQPTNGATCVMCIEPVEDVWRIPSYRTPLFGTGYFAKILDEESEQELRSLLDEIHDIRHGLKKSPLPLMLEKAWNEEAE